MTDEMRAYEKAICEVAKVSDIGEVSDGFHTFNGLYEQRMILFAALVKAYKDKAWKSYRHEDGEWCFGGGWFVVGIDTPEGSYTYHYENKYWDMFDCIDLPRAPHWDGHTEADAETRLMSLEPEQQWVPCSEGLPDIKEHHVSEPCIVYCENGAYGFAELEENIFGQVGWNCEREDEYHEPLGEVIAWMPLPEPYKGGADMREGQNEQT